MHNHLNSYGILEEQSTRDPISLPRPSFPPPVPLPTPTTSSIPHIPAPLIHPLPHPPPIKPSQAHGVQPETHAHMTPPRSLLAKVDAERQSLGTCSISRERQTSRRGHGEGLPLVKQGRGVRVGEVRGRNPPCPYICIHFFPIFSSFLLLFFLFGRAGRGGARLAFPSEWRVSCVALLTLIDTRNTSLAGFLRGSRGVGCVLHALREWFWVGDSKSDQQVLEGLEWVSYSYSVD